MENKKCTKIKLVMLAAVFTVLALIISWFIYANFLSKIPFSEDQQSAPIPQEIEALTRQLYDLELKHNPYLVKVNFQGKTDTSSKDDVAPLPLLQVNETALSLPALKTTLLLRRLHDNYELNTSISENVTSEENEEEMDFLQAILATPIMNKTMMFLESKDAVGKNFDSHLELLKTLWFLPYSRKPGDKTLSSTGFEHVFLSEIRKKSVLGLLNWIYFSEQERLGHLDYKGYIEKETLEEGFQYIVAFRSQFYNRTKAYNGIFVGTSPELEMSLYTVCFVLKAGKPCPVQLADLKFQIITWPIDYEGKKTIASAYASIKRNGEGGKSRSTRNYSTPATTTTTTSSAKDEKCAKIKRFIVFGVLAALAIIGWHLYEHFTYDPSSSKDHVTTTEHEIHEFTQKLYELEMQHNPYLAKVNFQGKTKASYRDDRAPQPLLQVHEDLMAQEDMKTIALMRRLFDNYELDTHAIEQITPEEEQEELDFLKAILDTPIMKKTMKFLEFKGAVTNNYNRQLQLLKDTWFIQYSRGHGRIGSSGFEHVFMAEIRDHNVLGLHNWVYFNEQEKLGNLDYKGYISKVDLEKDSHYLAAIRFQFHHINKAYNTLLVGTSPELELSLYTTCFLLSVGKPCSVQLGHVNFSIVTHAWDWHGKKTIATAYPSIEK